MKREKIALLGVVVLLFGGQIAFAVSPTPFGNWSEGESQNVQIDTTNDTIEASSGQGTWNSSLLADRRESQPESINLEVGQNLGNWEYRGWVNSYGGGPQLIIDPNATYPYKVLIASPDDPDGTSSDGVDVYGTKTFDGSGNWTLLNKTLQVDSDNDGAYDETDVTVFDGGTRTNGTYYLAAGDDEIYKGDSIYELSLVGPFGLNNAPDIHYENGTWHAFTEEDSQSTECCSSPAIAHWTADNVTGPWTFQSNVSRINNKVGDPEIIEVGEWYYIFYDFQNSTVDHPDYYIQASRSRDLYNWTYMGVVTSDYAGDADVRYDPTTDQFIMVTEYENGTSNMNIGLRTSPGLNTSAVQGRVGVDTDGDGVVDEVSQYQDIQYNYSFDSSDQQIVDLEASVPVSSQTGYGYDARLRLDNGAIVGSGKVNANVKQTYRGPWTGSTLTVTDDGVTEYQGRLPDLQQNVSQFVEMRTDGNPANVTVDSYNSTSENVLNFSANMSSGTLNVTIKNLSDGADYTILRDGETWKEKTATDGTISFENTEWSEHTFVVKKESGGVILPTDSGPEILGIEFSNIELGVMILFFVLPVGYAVWSRRQ